MTAVMTEPGTLAPAIGLLVDVPAMPRGTLTENSTGVLVPAAVTTTRIESAATILEAKAASAFSPDVVQSRNPAKQIAIRLKGHPVMLVANHRSAEPIAWRWKGQLNENSKHLAWVSVLPEMSHNEVDGLVNPRNVVSRIAAVLIRDQGDHPRIARRFEWLAGYLRKRDIHVEVVRLEGEDPMARMLGGVALGDFVSYYLALRNGADPSALPGVTALKKALAK